MDSNLLLLALEVKKLKKEKSAPPVPVKGDQGDKGDTGETGARGADGLDGAKGDKGDKGDAGKDGLNGADGVSVVDAEVDIDGTLAFSLSNGETIKTSSEVVGPKGPPGMQGAAGVGLASGGTTGQVATKASDDNYDVTWVSPFNPESPPPIGLTTPDKGAFTTLEVGGNLANYLALSGGATTKAVQFQTLGTDTNISVAVQPKGTGAISLAAGSKGVNISNGGTITAITRTASGGPSYTTVPTITISPPTTAGGVQATALATMFIASAVVSAGGTGYTIGDVLSVTGGTLFSGTPATLTVATLSGSAVATVTITNAGSYTALPTNPVSVTGGTGSGATFTLGWGVNSTYNITNAGSGYVEQPTVTFSSGTATAYATVGGTAVVRSIGQTGIAAMDFLTAQGITAGVPALRIRDVASDSYPQINNTGNQALIVASGGTNANFGISAAGTGSVRLMTSGTNQLEQMRISNTTSAVNYVNVTGAATGASPTISAQGSDANLALQLASKNTAAVSLVTNNAKQFDSFGPASAANFIRAAGNVAGSSPSFSALGSDPNIDLTLTPKGTGSVVATAPVRLQGYTVATLPTAGTIGRTAYVTDALAPSFLVAVVGGGAVKTPVFDNGTAWVSY